MPSMMMAIPQKRRGKALILGVETVDVIIDQGLDFSGGRQPCHPPVVPIVTQPFRSRTPHIMEDGFPLAHRMASAKAHTQY